MYLNKVQLIGNLTRDPEMKALPNGTKVTSFALAKQIVPTRINLVQRKSLLNITILCLLDDKQK
jgi:single-stranded DNA-binding protein